MSTAAVLHLHLHTHTCVPAHTHTLITDTHTTHRYIHTTHRRYTHKHTHINTPHSQTYTQTYTHTHTHTFIKAAFRGTRPETWNLWRHSVCSGKSPTKPHPSLIKPLPSTMMILPAPHPDATSLSQPSIQSPRH